MLLQSERDCQGFFNALQYAVQVLDLRSADEFQQSHARTASHITDATVLLFSFCFLQIKQKM